MLIGLHPYGNLDPADAKRLVELITHSRVEQPFGSIGVLDEKSFEENYRILQEKSDFWLKPIARLALRTAVFSKKSKPNR